MSEVAGDAIAYQPKNAMVFRWDFERVRVEDATTLRCTFENTRVVALHAVAGPKPWQHAAAGEASPRNAYARLLRRLLTAEDARVRVDARALPRWLQRGAMGSLSFAGRGWVRAVRSTLPRHTGVVARARKLRGRR